MEQKSLLAGHICSASQKVPCILRNLKVCYLYSQECVPDPSRTKWILLTVTHPVLRSILILPPTYIRYFKWSVSIWFSDQKLSMYHTLLPLLSACATHLILFYVVVQMISGEEYKLRSFSWCSFLQPPVISLYLLPKYSPHILSVIGRRERPRDQVWHSTQNSRQQYSVKILIL